MLVIINNASPISDSIGTYFAQQRNVPANNIARINVPTAEEITGTQFDDLRAQVEQYITSRNLTHSLNYLVTTKGMPLKVTRATANECSSVESELTLILGRYASYIGGNGRAISPYYDHRDNFSHETTDIYLVTRLDGYTYQDVKRLIDRSATTATSLPSNGTVVLDQDPAWNSSAPYLNTNMTTAATALQGRGVNTLLETSSLYQTHQSNVLGYVSWGSNDHYQSSYTTNGKPHNTYLPGAIAETYVSTSARSFANPPAYGQSLIADLIAEGITGVKGYVYEPYSSAMANVSILFSMFADGYTLAECYYSSSCYLSWMDVVIGDPKFRLVNTRIVSGQSNGNPLPVQLTSFCGTQRNGKVTLEWNTATEIANQGFEIEHMNPGVDTGNMWTRVGFIEGHGTTNVKQSYAYTFTTQTGGKHLFRLKQIDRDGLFTYSESVEVTVAQSVAAFVLDQNYPNPFNPSTTIGFTVNADQHVSVSVYNTLGQQVGSLFNGQATGGKQYSLSFKGVGLPSGTYFYDIRTEHERDIKKMTLAK